MIGNTSSNGRHWRDETSMGPYRRIHTQCHGAGQFRNVVGTGLSQNRQLFDETRQN